MNPSNKVLASVAGVCITSAVVIGAVLGSSAPKHSPAQQPAGNPAPIARTVTVTTSASHTAHPVAAVSPSITKAAAPVRHRKTRRAAIPVNQEPAVTDPSSTPPQADSTLIDQGSGVVDESGIRRAPSPSDPIRHGPSAEPPPPHAPSPSN